MQFKKIFYWIINQGIKEGDSSIRSRQTRTTNLIITLGAIFEIPMAIINPSNDILMDRLILGIYSIGCLFFIYANSKRYYDFSRLGYLFFTYIMISILADFQNRESGIVVSLLMPFVITFIIFGYKEKGKILISVFFALMCFFALEYFNYDITHINRNKTLENLRVDYIYNITSTIFAFVFVLFYYSRQFYIYEKDLKKSVEKSKLSEEIANAIIETNSDLIWIIDKDYKLIKFNNAFRFGYKSGFGIDVFLGYDLIDSFIDVHSKFYPSWKAHQIKWKNTYDRCLAGENFVEYDEIELLDATVYLENALYHIKISNETSYVAVFSKDVTAKVLYDKKINQSLIEKELLLKEIHHRVKNNMQIIIGLLQLQELYINDERISSIFSDINNRVKAMSLVHELLYQSEDLSFIDFNNYVAKLCNHISSSYKETTSKITISYEQKPHFLTVETAIPLGLLVNELFTNALKYAFKDRDNGKIEMGIKEENNEFVFYFCDNGVGIPNFVDFESATTLGLNLIHRLAEQINAELKIENKNGTEFYLTLEK